ncbi:unnamed protein product, partial [Clonostachys byssicola]
MAGSDPDPELERSNASHRHLIDVLKQTFEILGGLTWQSAEAAGQRADDEETIEEVIFSNKFSALDIGAAVNSSSEEEAELPKKFASRRRQTNKSGKGKKGKGKGKKGKSSNKQNQVSSSSQAALEDLPLESYKIVEDFNARNGENGTGLLTDYLMDVYLVFRNLLVLRASVQNKWAEVAYDDLNSAVAGAMSNVAIATIKKIQSSIFFEYPGNDSFDAILNALTRGNPEKMRDNFEVGMWACGPGGQGGHQVHGTYLDIQEQFLMYSYKDLCDFITDFQLNRTGKPTKRMQAEVRNWNPKLNLASATKEERIQWRRAYTINWLYDLVNVFSSVVVHRNTLEDESHDLSKVDWSSSGPWHAHRRLFGLNEFAAFVSSLAWQKPGAPIKVMVLPHHVFQLQCIVDSWTVSRGWSLSFVHGHVLRPPSHNFIPRRDLDPILNRGTQAVQALTGSLQAESVLQQLLERDGIRRGHPEAHSARCAILKQIRDEFDGCLGRTILAAGLDTIPTSRFADTDVNGLYNYSPFQCGVGSLEALELSYLVSTYIWDQVPEPLMLLHLHNMVVKKGYLKTPVELWLALEQIFGEALFPTGKAPTSRFAQTFSSHCKNVQAQGSAARATKLKAAKNANNALSMLDPESNISFRSKPYVQLLRQGEWDPDRVPDEEIPLETLTCMLRLSRLKMKKDELTGRLALADPEAPLARRAKARGYTEEHIAQLSFLNPWEGDAATKDECLSKTVMDNMRRSDPEKFKGMVTGDQDMWKKHSPGGSMNPEEMMGLCGWDVYNSICGDQPVLGLSFVWVTASVYVWFEMLEEELKKLRNPVYVSAYEDPTFRGDQRNRLVMGALGAQDEECMKTVAKLFEKSRCGFVENMYWNKIETSEKRTERMNKARKGEELGCVVM